MVTNPGDTINSTVEAFSHPVQTFRAIESAISESYKRDVINGDAYSRANWFSYAVGTVGTSIVGTKGLGAVGKTGVATTKSAAQTGIVATKNATSSIANLLPYTPRPQLAMAGDVPFNTLNGVELKNQLISMARVESVGRGVGNKVSDYFDDIIVNGNVNTTKMNKLKNAIQNNTFSVDELSEIRKKMSDLGISKEYDEALIKIDFGKYLRELIGEPPSAMIDPHAHHILFKKGLGEKQQNLVREGQEILKKYGIEPVIGKEKLVWAPNRIAGQHSIATLENVVNQLKAVDAAGGDFDDITEMLEDLGKQAASRK